MSYRIKLIKGMSYTGNGIQATKKNPEITVEDKATAEKAVASGFFKLIEEVAEQESGDEDGQEADQQDGEEYQPTEEEIAVENMSLAQLKDIAAQMGISKSGLKTKADYIAAIEAAADAADEAAGSPTMVELQEA
ncbi:MAG: hypothetical protein LIO54_08570 [Oscillospiraceae bacterium]|nr:hypothetical protein [Oscillospiraceae bacterium]